MLAFIQMLVNEVADLNRLINGWNISCKGISRTWTDAKTDFAGKCEYIVNTTNGCR